MAEGWRVGKERVRLIRKQEGLQVIRKNKRKRLLGKSTTEMMKATYPNQVWSYDLVVDRQPVAGGTVPDGDTSIFYPFAGKLYVSA